MTSVHCVGAVFSLVSSAVSTTVAAVVTAVGAGVGLFLMLSIQHLEQHPPVASEPKKPHPDLQSLGALDACLLLALMVVVLFRLFVCSCVCDTIFGSGY